MKPLQPPDTFHLLAAQGWMELGNHEEANEELELIDASPARPSGRAGGALAYLSEG